MKLFLLIAGDGYHPEVGTGDWRGCYATHEEALSHVIITDDSYHPITVDGVRYDWYMIVNLAEWLGHAA